MTLAGNNRWIALASFHCSKTTMWTMSKYRETREPLYAHRVIATCAQLKTCPLRAQSH